MNIFERINERLRRRKEREAVRRADYIFQVQEHDGELWLTFNGCMVCPEKDAVNGYCRSRRGASPHVCQQERVNPFASFH